MFKTTTIIVIVLETGLNPQSPALFSVSWQVITYDVIKINTQLAAIKSTKS